MSETIVVYLGIEDYSDILSLQMDLNSARNAAGIGDVVLFLQHPDVYTAGIHFKGDDNDISVPIQRISRGGYLTYHGPGQIVVYFIRNLLENNENVKQLIEKLETAVIGTLSTLGIEGRGLLGEKTGVWVGDRKVCSIGLGVIGFTTIHGMALNVNTDLRKFEAINPCNFPSSVMTSISDLLGEKISVEDVQPVLLAEISKVLNITEKKEVYSVQELREFISQ